MNRTIEAKVQTAWDFSFEKLFCEKTNLFYDYLHTANSSIEYLPTPEEIAANCPNPCGWGTGMEDSALNGGSAMEGIIARFEATGDENMKALAKKVFKGLYTLASVSKDKGFLARSVSPIDGKSHYIDSSRDQYTHWIYGAHRYYNSSMSSEEEKAQIKQVLVWFAEKAERDVTEENGWYLLREDGRAGVVSRMYGDRLCGHETHRLPMIYMAAWEVSGDKHWLDKYNEYRDWATEYLEEHIEEEKTRAWSYPLLQMQYSLRLLYDCEPDNAYKLRYGKLLNEIGSIVEQYMDKGIEYLPNLTYRGPIGNWRYDAPFNMLYFFHGAAYFLPKVYEDNMLARMMRNFSEAYIIKALAPNCKLSESEENKLIQMCETLDFNKSEGYWPLLFACAYWVLREKDK